MARRSSHAGQSQPALHYGAPRKGLRDRVTNLDGAPIAAAGSRAAASVAGQPCPDKDILKTRWRLVAGGAFVK